MCVCVFKCVRGKQLSALRFSLQDQLFHPWVQSAALADGGGRADTYYHLMEGEDRGGRKPSGEGGGMEGHARVEREMREEYKVRRKRKTLWRVQEGVKEGQSKVEHFVRTNL